MPSEKEKYTLKSKEYKIKGNSFTGFYDSQGKLVFVLDSTIDKLKPNVLLVMTSHGDRKWDDVLANDYGMNLELVRPKKDNKYQKLDVEYDGLDVYDDLIHAYTDGGDVKSALQKLGDFRVTSVRRSATERIDVSSAIAETARETIERTNDTIIELQAKIKALRAKIKNLRGNIGREPTKQSAAKILRAEAQLDVLIGKLERAKKRLENANKRLTVAEDDIDAARKVLDLIPGGAAKGKQDKSDAAHVVTSSIARIPTKTEDVDTEIDDDDNLDDDGDSSYDDVDMDSEEYESNDDYEIEKSDGESDVKPLFDTDPNIMDENIAFKPINFDEKSVALDTSADKDGDSESLDSVNGSETSFTPPKSIMDVVSVPEQKTDSDVKLDSVFSETLDDVVDYDKNTGVDGGMTAGNGDLYPDTEDDVVINEKLPVPVAENTELESEGVDTIQQTVPVSDDTLNITSVTEQRNPPISAPAMPSVSTDASVARDNLVRPMSPVQEKPVINSVPVVDGRIQHRPNLLYYVLLLVLIGLSVFTLWLYQRSNVSGDVLPTVIKQDAPIVAQQTQQPQKYDAGATEFENPFVASAQDAVPEQPAPILEKVAQDSLNKIAAAADIQSVTSTDDAADNDVAPSNTDSVMIDEPENEVSVNKPEYDVGQDKTITSGAGIIGGNLCDGDVAPDANGCCPGEVYSNVDGQNVCCPDNGGDCFAPLF